MLMMTSAPASACAWVGPSGYQMSSQMFTPTRAPAISNTWARLRGVVRRHALLLVDGDLQREASVVNVIAHEVRPLVEAAAAAGAPEQPAGVRQLGHAGMRRLG